MLFSTNKPLATCEFTVKYALFLFIFLVSKVDIEASIVIWLVVYDSVHSEHNSYSGTVRLAKRWLASQMLLSDFIEEETVELIVASLYLSPAPFTPPRYDSHFVCFTQ